METNEKEYYISPIKNNIFMKTILNQTNKKKFSL